MMMISTDRMETLTKYVLAIECYGSEPASTYSSISRELNIPIQTLSKLISRSYLADVLEGLFSSRYSEAITSAKDKLRGKPSYREHRICQQNQSKQSEQPEHSKNPAESCPSTPSKKVPSFDVPTIRTKEIEALLNLGTIPTTEIASYYGISLQRVSEIRKEFFSRPRRPTLL